MAVQRVSCCARTQHKINRSGVGSLVESAAVSINDRFGFGISECPVDGHS